MLNIFKSSEAHKFRFTNLELCCNHGVIIGTTFGTQRPAYIQFFQKIVNQIIFELTSTVGIKNAETFQIWVCRCKCFAYQLCIFMASAVVPHDFAIMQIPKKHKYSSSYFLRVRRSKSLTITLCCFFLVEWEIYNIRLLSILQCLSEHDTGRLSCLILAIRHLDTRCFFFASFTLSLRNPYIC